MHNDEYLCKAKELEEEDIVCKQGKAEAIKKTKIINTNEGRLK
jgi:hypothetical protein